MFSMVDKLYSSRTREGHAILSETRWPAPSLCGGSVDSRAVFLRAKFFFETRPGTVHVLCEHFRGSTNQHAIPNRRTSAKGERNPFNVVHNDLANYSREISIRFSNASCTMSQPAVRRANITRENPGD